MHVGDTVVVVTEQIVSGVQDLTAGSGLTLALATLKNEKKIKHIRTQLEKERVPKNFQVLIEMVE